MSFLLSLLAAAGVASGVVFDDANGNGRQDPGEFGLPRVVVTDGRQVVVTDAEGRYRLEAPSSRDVFVVTPGDRRVVGAWHRAATASADFALAPAPAGDVWRFAHLSDTHVEPGNVDRFRRALRLAQERGADFAVVSGDLVKDSLRVGEATARAQFALYTAETAAAGIPVRSVMGNHDVFAIERHLSLVPTTHPAYAKAMYEETIGPPYYAFNRGAVHFIVLDTIGMDDTWYYGYLDPAQLEWIKAELKYLPESASVVTVGHIPLRSGALSMAYTASGIARTLLQVGDDTSYRHVVRNAAALEEILKPYGWSLALQGHTHLGEQLRPFDGGHTRYHTAPAVDHPIGAQWPSGLVIYTVRGGLVDDGETLRLDEK